MATGRPPDAICRIVKHRIMELETEAGREPDYNGVLMFDGMLIVVDIEECNLEIHNGHNGKRITSHRLVSNPLDVCLINKNEVAVCLGNGKVVILSLKSIDDVKLVKTLETGFDICYSLAKWNSDKLVISGWKDYGMLCWGILSTTDGPMDSTHDICKGFRTHMAVKDNTLYISCWTDDSINEGVYVYDLSNSQTLKFLYQHQELETPWSIMAVRDYVYVCDENSNTIHQLTDSGQLVTIHTVSSDLDAIFYDDQHGLLYTTRWKSNVITVYKMESLHQPDPLLPVEILSMDDNSIQLYKRALHAGKEKVYNIRVMVVGQFGVGKTTLIKRLLGQPVDISERKSTEGIDVHKHCCKISLDKGEWIQQVDDSDQLYTLHRLNKLLSVPDQEPDISQEQDDIVEVIYQREITSVIDATKSNVTSTTSVSDQEVQSSTQSSITRGDGIHHVEHLDKETDIVAVPLSDSKSSESEKKKDAMMEILRLVNENADKLVKDIEKYAALSIWDFAGQYTFYTTHQMFLTSRAIYLLVIDLSQQITNLIQDDNCFLDAEGIKERQVLDLIQIWMNSIHCSVASPETIIPVILVGTHVDKLSEKSRKEVIDKYFIELRYMLREKPTIRHLMDDIAIDNTQPDPMLEELKKRIFEVSKEQPHWGEEKPARWLPLEQAIMTLKASGTKVVQLSLIEEINMSGSVKIEDRNEFELFLKFHHDIGTILYFSVEELRKKIVLDPQWMIDALKSLITAEAFIKKYPAVTRKFYEFIKTGKLTHELIDVIWTKEKNPEFHYNKDHILRLMEQLNIIAIPRIYSEEGKVTKEEDYFLAPCMLQQKTPEEIISPERNSQMESSPVLCYVFTGNFLPTAIFHRLVAACIAHWPVAKKKNEHSEENLIFCGCCVFKLNEQHKLTLHFIEHVIFLRVTRMGIKDKTPSSKLCIEVREFITRNLLKIIGYLGKGLKFEYFIQCPEYNGVSINSLIPVSRLEEEAEVYCEFHGHIIESCKVLDFWFEDQVKNIDCKDTDDVNAPITQEHINHARLCNALTNVCSNALREILLTNVPTPHTDIYKAILANKAKLKKLNKEQIQLVFPDPQGLSTGKVEEFDISLLCTIIRNISSVPAPSNGWGKPPAEKPRDTTLGANVERIRSYRNHIVGHDVHGKICQQEFEDYWAKIDKVLREIEIVIGNHGYLEDLEKRKNQAITPHEAHQLQKTFKEYKKRKEAEAFDIESAAETLMSKVKKFRGNFLPSATFHRLVAACIAHWLVARKKKEHREENLIFCGCCIFQLDEQYKLTLHFIEHVIFLRVTRMGIKDKTPSSKLCIEVREFITRNLLKIIGYLGKGLKFEYFIQCPEYNGVCINCLIPVSRLNKNAEVHCEFHDHMIESSYRNHISGHSVDGTISQKEFEDYWAKIHEVLREIKNVIGNHGYLEDLEKRKNQAITPHEARELQKKFQEYKKQTEDSKKKQKYTVKNIDGQDKDDVDTPITQEHINHARLCNALTTVCSNALREILLTNVPKPHPDIYKAILANKAKLNKLNKEQARLVFPDPRGSSTGKVEEFDISLLYTIIRNVSSVPAPSNGWGNPPADNPRDTTLGANVERIRSYRNHIVGHDVHGKICQQEFEDYWAKIDKVLREIEIVIGNHGYLEDLEKRKNQAFTLHETHELQKKFQKYRKRKEAAASAIGSAAETLMSEVKKFRCNQK